MKAAIRDPNNGYKEAMEGFLKEENWLEALYASSPSKDTVALVNEPPKKYKKKGIIILRIGSDTLTE